MTTILCVEDDKVILANNKKNLMDNGYNVLTAETVAEARAHLSAAQPDGIVLDIMLPDGNGLDLLKEIKAKWNHIPVLMLTAWNTSADETRGLDAGADDYIGKPFTYDVLLARVRKMLTLSRRVPETITRGALTLKLTSMVAYLNDEDMLLSQKEFSLLLFFVQRENSVMSADYVYEQVWGQPMQGNKAALEKMIYRLRQSLKGSGCDIFTKRGQGYYFQTQ
jgi:DNA-binding response OmpR family regulator